MLVVQIVGGLLLAAGLFLFVASQWTGGKHSTDDAGLNAWKISISGPPGLILIVIGVVVLLFPHSPWWPGEDRQVAIPTTVTTEPTTTTTTSLVEDYFPGDLLPWPETPFDVRLEGECQTTPAIAWTPGDDQYVDWYVVIDLYFQDEYIDSYAWDSGIDEWVFGWDFSGQAYPAWCFWEDYDPEMDYGIYVYAYNESGFSEPGYLFVESSP